MNVSLAGVHVKAECLVHGLRGDAEVHPFDIILIFSFFLICPCLVRVCSVYVFQGIHVSGQPGGLAHDCLARVCFKQEDAETQQAQHHHFPVNHCLCTDM